MYLYTPITTFPRPSVIKCSSTIVVRKGYTGILPEPPINSKIINDTSRLEKDEILSEECNDTAVMQSEPALPLGSYLGSLDVVAEQFAGKCGFHFKNE